MRFGSLFSGIGGLDLGLERAGMECAWQVEIDEWCRRVLARHWPDVPRYEDAKAFPPHPDADGERSHRASFNEYGKAEQGRVELRNEPVGEPGPLGESLGRYAVDLIAGGFPCQPVSHAGRRRGQDDERWLWPEFARIVRLLRPRYVLVENVPGLLARGMGDVLGDLAACGYDAEWDCIPAAAVGAPHLRYRVFIVAYRNGGGREVVGEPEPRRLEGSPGHIVDRRGEVRELIDAEMADAQEQSVGARLRQSGSRGKRRGRSGDGSGSLADAERAERWTPIFGRSPQGRRSSSESPGGGWWTTEPDVGRVAYGVPSRVDRLRGLGNAVVPQVAEWIGRRIMNLEEAQTPKPSEA